ncbi:PucR family transcriptional regulator [Fundicoccus culcitae]|uniref:Helix-turn-helix domain-containing protein n=1 Tax=Fundicoccus culcitae TaxID=2969821 RepID=A0ABY5P381_9LACT|nr:helix-turn-helix domain-containing protein [Fundicoccus culcitae]UUX33124.1 helix-turn-helix domain-containing protein [Fundicoccus culcitae]
MYQSLKKLYPDLLINPSTPINTSAYIHLVLDGDDLYIPADQVGEKEQALLAMLDERTAEVGQSYPQSLSPWSRFLLGQSTDMPSNAASVRWLHLDFQALPENFEYVLWLETLSEAIPAIIATIPYTERRLTIVLSMDEAEGKLVEDLYAVLQTLDSDFDLITKALVGQTYQVNSQLPELYQLEVDLFEQALKNDYIQPFSTLPITLLRMMGRSFYNEQPLLRRVQQTILTHPDYISTITKLFENQGNLSQTADQLFIHRNTLTYRMNKFYKETGYNLQHLPDLILCYLAI